MDARNGRKDTDTRDELDTPVEDAGRRRFRRLLIVGGILVVACMVGYVVWAIMGIVFVGRTDEGMIGVVHRLMGVPVFLVALGLGIAVTAMTAASEQGVKPKLLAAGLIALMVFVFYLLVGQPLMDVPYLFDPVVVELDDVRTRCTDSSEDVSYYLEGVDQEGRAWSFRINPATYYDWDPARTSATVTGLPNTGVTLAIQ